MEPAIQTEDLKNKIEDFNAITQNTKNETAKTFLEMCHNDLNKAISLYLENGPDFISTHNSTNYDQPSINPISQNDQFASYFNTNFSNINNNISSDNRINESVKEYIRCYRERERNNSDFTYIRTALRTTSNLLKGVYNKLIPISIRGETQGGEEFNYYMKNLKNIKNISFNNGKFDENLQTAFDNNKPLLVFIFEENPETVSIQLSFLTNDVINDYCNKNYINLGLLSSKREGENLILSTTAKPGSINIFRKSIITEKTLLMETIKFTKENSDIKFYFEAIKRVRLDFDSLFSEEKEIEKQGMKEINIENSRALYYNNMYNLQYNYANDDAFYSQQFNMGSWGQQTNPPPNPAVQRKLEQDRMLKKAQDEEYKLAQKKAEELNLKKLQEEENQKKEIQRIKEEEEEKINIKKIEMEEKKRRKSQLPEEPIESDQTVIEILFRLPNGQRITRKFRKDNEIKYLYYFVETHENINITQFDIIRNIPFVNLSDKKELKIIEVFEDSNQELLHVRDL